MKYGIILWIWAPEFKKMIEQSRICELFSLTTNWFRKITKSYSNIAIFNLIIPHLTESYSSCKKSMILEKRYD